ncbi:MAG TPA: hypothetical protein PLH94_13145 [Fimbriimonadaceae bacterium]|nr:hypothetical protein [Fimbriimonadaceae bacterium]
MPNVWYVCTEKKLMRSALQYVSLPSWRWCDWQSFNRQDVPRRYEVQILSQSMFGNTGLVRDYGVREIGVGFGSPAIVDTFSSTHVPIHQPDYSFPRFLLALEFHRASAEEIERVWAELMSTAFALATRANKDILIDEQWAPFAWFDGDMLNLHVMAFERALRMQSIRGHEA